jgi:hypothetical protein
MYQASLLQDCHGIQQLGHEHLDKLGAEPLELVLLDEFIEIRGQQLKDETEVISMDEGVA